MPIDVLTLIDACGTVRAHLETELGMSRLQLALNVADLDAAVDFYTRLFDTPPHKLRDGYANFAIAEPPLKLVLFAGGEPGTTSINHLGVEVMDPDEVVAAKDRFVEAGLTTRDSIAELCCHAVQDKVYVDDPNGREWEFYTILDDEPEVDESAAACATDACAVPAAAGAVAGSVAGVGTTLPTLEDDLVGQGCC